MLQRHAITISVQLLLSLLIANAARAADWPMYRADAARSGYTAEAMPDSLTQAWSYRASAPKPAWPSNDRLTFDRACQPIIAGGTLYFGSSADCAIHALDATSGAVKWTCLTEAPIRFAPVAWNNRVFVAGDDGLLRCLDAANGRERWRKRLAPKPEMLLGNDFMISRWPARGGPVLADGILYVGAGIWPSEDVFIYAIDPESGRVRWCNDSSGTLEMDQPHPGARARSGIAAHGYLAVNGGELFVPTGRAVPAVLDRESGRLKSFPLAANTHRGGADVVPFDGNWFNHGYLYPAEKTGRPVSIGARVAVHPRWFLACKRDRLYVYDRAGVWKLATTRTTDGKEVATKSLASAAWKLTLPHGAEEMIVAGEKAIIGGPGCVSMVDLGARQLVWTARVEGAAQGLAASGGRLYVSTDKGVIYCFRDAQIGSRGIARETTPVHPAEQASSFAAAADEILRISGVREGYCLDLGCGDGQLTIELARRSQLRIFAVDHDGARLDRLRRTLDAAGWYGWRVMVFQADPEHPPFPRWFADLIVSGRSITQGERAVSPGAIGRFQRPWGGVACLGRPGAMKLATRGGLEGAGQWTHQYADPANTLCSADALLRGPLSMLWFRDTDLPMPQRHGRSPAPLVVRGRMFVEGLNALRAIDIYNGRTLWQAPLPENLKRFDQDHLVGTAATGSNLCASDDRIFLAHDDRCTVYSAADGSQLGEFTTPPRPDGKPAVWGFLACENKTLFGSVADDRHMVTYKFQKSNMDGLWTESRVLFALDAASGKPRWIYTARDSIRHNAIAIGGGRVYLIDRPLAEMDTLAFEVAKQKAAAARKAAGAQTKPTTAPVAPKLKPGRLVALDAESGKPIWEVRENIFGTLLALNPKYDVLLMSYQPGSFQLPSEAGGRMAAIRASDGYRMWDISARYSARPILNDRRIYALPGAWDLLTGRTLETGMRKSYACGIPAGAQDMLVLRSATIGYIDLASPRQMENYGGIRPGCWVNTIPAGGLMLMADSASGCQCSYLNQATIALQPAE